MSLSFTEAGFKKRATDKNQLVTRLAVNLKYQSRDFHEWLHQRLNVNVDEHILDVGCGTGAQTLRFLQKIGAKGSVSCLDISKESINQLKQVVGNDSRFQAHIGCMSKLDSFLREFKVNRYNLAHSSYALYYADKPIDVLQTMANSIFPDGRVAIFAPVFPHGLVDIAAKFSTIPAAVLESLRFGPDKLEPAFRELFWQVEIHYFQSEMRVSSLEDFMNFYDATTYSDVSVRPAIQDYASSCIEKNGAVVYPKNGYLIIGKECKLMSN